MGIFLIWVGILVGVPALIWDESAVNWSGMAGLVAAMMLPVMLESFGLPFAEDYPLTTMHLCYVAVFSAALCVYVIGGEDGELFVSTMFGVAALIISFVVDNVFYKKDKSNERML